ncbi:MAG: cysteine--tRNA ligase, partial [Candidatus Woesebacteria bacterium]|nr:cysteine--tRNA ligase [Candidatus Woesebacteria bacterium]
EDKGFGPLDLRYFYLSGKYNEQLNFTWEGLNSAKIALEKIQNQLEIFKSNKDRSVISNEKLEKLDKYRNDFISSLNDDLNTPKALATLWEVIKSGIPSQDKYDLILDFDEVLGLNLKESSDEKHEVPENIKKLINERNKLRNEKRFEESDKIRDKIIELGFGVKDTAKNG